MFILKECEAKHRFSVACVCTHTRMRVETERERQWRKRPKFLSHIIIENQHYRKLKSIIYYALTQELYSVRTGGSKRHLAVGLLR